MARFLKPGSVLSPQCCLCTKRRTQQVLLRLAPPAPPLPYYCNPSQFLGSSAAAPSIHHHLLGLWYYPWNREYVLLFIFVSSSSLTSIKGGTFSSSSSLSSLTACGLNTRRRLRHRSVRAYIHLFSIITKTQYTDIII